MKDEQTVQDFLSAKLTIGKHAEPLFRPVFIRLSEKNDVDVLQKLIDDNAIAYVCDELHEQLKELVKLRNPGKRLSEDEYSEEISALTAGNDLHDHGVWIYYPWKKTLVHALDEDEFIEVRTNRNKNKITLQEQNSLRHKTVGIIGLSVGNSIATTIAMERICGTIRLADFDTIELSNLNRIKTGLTNLSLPKVVVAAREIAEIDPFLNVEIFSEGISSSNIAGFLNGDSGPLSVLVEVCDNLEVKLIARHHARQHKIPVIMDTSDRGMVDVERFDLHPDLPIFHGKIDETDIDFSSIKLDDAQRFHVLKSIVDYDKLSEKMKSSMAEIGKSISTWPQLASSVTLGGGATTELCRKVLLNEHTESGRYYVDLDQIFSSQ